MSFLSLWVMSWSYEPAEKKTWSKMLWPHIHGILLFLMHHNRMQHRRRCKNTIWEPSKQQADNWNYFHVCLKYLLCFYCSPALLTSSLRGVGVNKHSNDVWTFGHAATMAPLDRCTYPHRRPHTPTPPPRLYGAFRFMATLKRSDIPA